MSKLPDGLITVGEFARCVGASYAVTHKWAKANMFPVMRLGPRFQGVDYFEAVKAPVIEDFLKRKKKTPNPPCAGTPRIAEPVIVKQAERPRYVISAENFEPLYVKSAQFR